MRGILAALVIAMLLPALSGCASTKQGGGTETVVTLMTGQGDITLRFFPDLAPEHVKNFIAHCKSGLYAGTAFHRVIPSFMIQGGDPNSKDDDPDNDGQGGYSYRGEGKMLPAEFSDRPHFRGILSMARALDPNSAGSQFFICQADTPFLDGNYTVFGEVIEGIRVVDKIVNVPRDKGDRPLEAQRIEGVRIDTWPTAKVEKTKTAMWKRTGST